MIKGSTGPTSSEAQMMTAVTTSATSSPFLASTASSHRPKGRRIVGDDRTELARLLRQRYESGVSIRDLAYQTGRSYGFVHRVLEESGTAMRGRGGDTRRGR
jgi:predicted transcriptional regulator